MVTILGLDPRLHRVEIICDLQRQVRPEGGGDPEWGVLRVIEIAVCIRGKDYIVAMRRWLLTVLSLTHHHHRIIRKSAMCDLIPAKKPPTFAFQVFSHPVVHITLQLGDIREAFLLHESLAMRAVLPCAPGSLVTADMNHFGGEKLNHLIDHRLKELVCSGIGRAHVAVEDFVAGGILAR